MNDGNDGDAERCGGGGVAASVTVSITAWPYKLGASRPLYFPLYTWDTSFSFVEGRHRLKKIRMRMTWSNSIMDHPWMSLFSWLIIKKNLFLQKFHFCSHVCHRKLWWGKICHLTLSKKYVRLNRERVVYWSSKHIFNVTVITITFFPQKNKFAIQGKGKNMWCMHEKINQVTFTFQLSPLWKFFETRQNWILSLLIMLSRFSFFCYWIELVIRIDILLCSPKDCFIFFFK